jgi:hypothetical protein
MNDFLNQLNLTAQERRILGAITLVVIIVLNLLFVWPHFGEWSKINAQLQTDKKTIADEYAAILQDRDPTNGLHKQVDKLAHLANSTGIENPQDPQVQLQTTIRAQERKTGVYVQDFNPGAIRTNNIYFEEHSTTISVESQETNLVSFLYNMGNDPAMIRVTRLDLKPADANRYKLKASMTLSANYAKKKPTAVAVAAKPAQGSKQAPPGPKPSTMPGPKGPPGPKPPPGPTAPGQQTQRRQPVGPFPGGNRQSQPAPFPRPQGSKPQRLNKNGQNL